MHTLHLFPFIIISSLGFIFCHSLHDLEANSTWFSYYYSNNKTLSVRSVTCVNLCQNIFQKPNFNKTTVRKFSFTSMKDFFCFPQSITAYELFAFIATVLQVSTVCFTYIVTSCKCILSWAELGWRMRQEEAKLVLLFLLRLSEDGNGMAKLECRRVK